MANVSKRPGGEMSSRPLHFFVMADCSGSMIIDGKIQALNQAVKEAIPHMQKEAEDNPNVQVFVRVIKFSTGAQWHVATPTPIKDFAWHDLLAEGTTSMGKALSMVADQLKMPPMEQRALPPVIFLLSDGQPTDNFDAGLQDLFNQPWGVRAARIAMAIGKDADHDALAQFVNNPEVHVLQVNNPDDLIKYIKWVSTSVLKAASSPASQSKDIQGGGNVQIPQPPPPSSNLDVW